jgi:signal peptidase II
MTGAMHRVSRCAFSLALVACVGCDQAAKHAAGLLLAGSERVTLLGDTVRFELVANPGAFLSLGAGLPELVRGAVLVGLVPVLLAFACLLVTRSALVSRGGLIALGLIVGGGLGNWLDRMLHHGAVTDFVSLGLGRFRTGIFNVADVAIVGGLMLLILFGRRAPSTGSTDEDA